MPQIRDLDPKLLETHSQEMENGSMSLEGLKVLIEENSDEITEFGDPAGGLSPSTLRIRETEAILGAKLPPSYLWYVNRYGSGEINGDEIFSIYPEYSDRSVGDIAYQSLWWRKNEFVSNSSIVICSNVFGEVWFLEPNKEDENGEFPVVLKSGNEESIYAPNFAQFLARKIIEAID